ncbi:MAG: hypothetical protein U0559_00230 [Anaerolineae bacterium]
MNRLAALPEVIVDMRNIRGAAPHSDRSARVIGGTRCLNSPTLIPDVHRTSQSTGCSVRFDLTALDRCGPPADRFSAGVFASYLRARKRTRCVCAYDQVHQYRAAAVGDFRADLQALTDARYAKDKLSMNKRWR